MTFDEYLQQENDTTDIVVDVCKETAREILKKVKTMTPTERFNKLKSKANCYAITCIYNQHGLPGVEKFLELGKKPR